jgi:hypothetical protein
MSAREQHQDVPTPAEKSLPAYQAKGRKGMALQKLFVAAILVLAVSLIAVKVASSSPGDESRDLSSLSNDELQTITVRFERIGCYGTCPAYAVTIHGDGRVEYTGKNHVKDKGTQEGRIEAATIKTLVSKFAVTKFLSLPEEYSEAQCQRFCTDMATAITELEVSGTTHRVKHYYGCGSAPKALFDLESAIDELANTKQWTGDVTKQGPYGTTCFNR